jgi:hypothetical protein
MEKSSLPKDFQNFLKLLNEHRVRYLLIGGYAVGFYGYPRGTVDMDFWIAIDEENAANLIEVIRQFGFDVPELTIDLISKQKKTIRMGLPPLRIEIMPQISGVEFDDCYLRRIRAVLDGIPVDIIDLERLKINKRASGRAKELLDLEYLP